MVALGLGVYIKGLMLVMGLGEGVTVVVGVGVGLIVGVGVCASTVASRPMRAANLTGQAVILDNGFICEEPSIRTDEAWQSFSSGFLLRMLRA
jgi:hypothetical protein